jgi:hypothetical protein
MERRLLAEEGEALQSAADSLMPRAVHIGCATRRCLQHRLEEKNILADRLCF